MAHDQISEPGRYYHGRRAIVLRSGMLLEEERWELWHELVHSDDGDEDEVTDPARERAVEREAGARAMPLRTLAWAFRLAENWYAVSALVRLPEDKVRWYVGEVLSDAERRALQQVSPAALSAP